MLTAMSAKNNANQVPATASPDVPAHAWDGNASITASPR
jgi:hypothetical protein